MPGVDVYYRSTVFMFRAAAEAIREVVARVGAKRFSVDEWPLSENDFSFKFHQFTEFDSLTNDIVVRIRLHDFPERRENIDQTAAMLAAYIADNLPPRLRHEGLSVGVEVMLAEIGWGTASTERPMPEHPKWRQPD